MIADEGHLRGGAAADIAAMIADKGFDFLDAPVKRVTALDVPIPFSPPLEKAAVPDEARIEARDPGAGRPLGTGLLNHSQQQTAAGCDARPAHDHRARWPLN